MLLRSSRRWTALAVLAAVVTLSGCSSNATTTSSTETAQASTTPCAVPEGETRKIVAGGITSGSYGAVYVADGLGYYEQAGLDVEFVSATSPTDTLGLLAGGELDVYLGAGSAGMLNQVYSGMDVRIAAGGGLIGTDQKYEAPSGFYVRKELFESGEVTEPADIRGRKVGSFGPAGSAVSYYIGLLAESGGLTLEDVELVPLTPPSAMQALDQGGVDVSYLVAPFASLAEERGIAVPLGNAKAIYGDEQAPVIMFGPNLLQEDRAAGCAFLTATMRGAQQLQGKYWKDAQVTAAFAEKLGVEPSFIRDNAIYKFDPTIKPITGTIEGMQRMFGDLGLLQYEEPMPVEDVFAFELWQQAVDARSEKQ